MSPIDMGLLPHLTQTLELGACVPFKVLKSPHLDSKSPISDNDLKALQTQSPIAIEIVSGSCKTIVHLEGLDEKVPATPKDISTIAQADLDADSLNFNSSPPSPSPVVCSHLDVFYHLIHNKSLRSCFGSYLFKQALLASQDKKSLDVGANLFIGNLDPDVDEKLLYDTFSAFGVIVTNPKRMSFVRQPKVLLWTYTWTATTRLPTAAYGALRDAFTACDTLLLNNHRCYTDNNISPWWLAFGRGLGGAFPVDAAWAPLVHNPRTANFYHVGLSGLGVGGVRVPISEDIFRLTESGYGGVIIDTGTAVTMLPTVAYEALRDAFTAKTSGVRARSVSIFDTCYRQSSDNFEFPSISFYFLGGPLMKPVDTLDLARMFTDEARGNIISVSKIDTLGALTPLVLVVKASLSAS
ncbi:hypothetical protein QYF36_023984 [Acer negundo]|nr:hypothetical protein QYF36_023984 [Acer negundo]